MEERTIDKYPRTPHFVFSPGQTDDDKVIHQKYLGALLNRELIITEKMDGQNNCLKGFMENIQNYGGAFARSHQTETKLPWDSYLLKWYHENKYQLKNNTAYFLENLFAIHSIEYKDLDGYLFLFNLFDLKNGMVLSYDEMIEEAERLGLKTPALLYRGKFETITEIKKWMEREIRVASAYGERREGFVLRVSDAFPINKFDQNVAKFVRENHVQTDEHWTKNWKQAPLKKG